MIIAKFGGSSVGSPERLVKVAELVERHPEYRAVVVSAFQGVTNDLLAVSAKAAARDPEYKDLLVRIETRHLDAASTLLPPKTQSKALVTLRLWLNELADALQGIFLLGELSARSQDLIASFGERFSAYILAELLESRGKKAQFLNAREIIVTDESFGSAHVDFPRTNAKISHYFKDHPDLQIVTGFIAATPKGEVTTLGRGGSDYTAAIVGAALNAAEIAIWTDVDGMLTADPRKVSKAFPLENISYEEAMELCHFGAKVIYPPTLQPAMDRRIPIRIVNTFRPDFPGTLIREKPKAHAHAITGISSIEQVALIRVEGSGLVGVAGTSSKLFGALAARKISVILISQASSEHSICFAVAPHDADPASLAIEDAFALELKAGWLELPIIERNLSIVSIVGENMRRVPGISGRLFRALGQNGINVVAIAQGSSELNISTVINAKDEAKALRALHDAFFLSGSRTAHVFLAGDGLVGSALLRQLAAQGPALQDAIGLEIELNGIVDSSRTLAREAPIPAAEASAILKSEGETGGIQTFVTQMHRLNLPNSIFVDCTASEDVASHYTEILDGSIPIATPNKRAQSGAQARFAELKRISRKRGVPLLYEASVGAGLPVIGTLADLIRSGDRVISIEAVLSGTLSFIFNSLAEDDTLTFSKAVLLAKERGFTEPDPRDDLNGRDAARKILILAREAGAQIEPDQVEIEPLLPRELLDAPSVDAFLSKLPSLDAEFAKRRGEAAKRGARLCYTATFENGDAPKAGIVLKALGPKHPFFSLSGSDNIISFRTARYDERPLVVKGPGAGAEVTAAGVFGDIIRLASYGRE